MRGALTLMSLSALIVKASASTCPGVVDVTGHGLVALTNAGSNVPGEAVGPLEVAAGDRIVAHMGARTYFADTCTEGTYRNDDYVAMKLLGKKLRYTADVSAAGCGCNAAFYLVSMRQNREVSSCNDYYCDANHVCGVKCVEVDIQEASKRAWHSTLHSNSDSAGLGGGFGGGDSWNGPRDFTSEQYGPGGRCIDTSRPFDVMVSFPVDETGSLKRMQVNLTQTGKNCPLTINLDDYHSMAEISLALAEGMTPVISYWKSGDMLWMDGKGDDGQGPCAEDMQKCGESVSFYGFTIENIESVGVIDLLQPMQSSSPTSPPKAPFLPEPSALPPTQYSPAVAPVTQPPISSPPHTLHVTQPPMFLPPHTATSTTQSHSTASSLHRAGSSSGSSSSSSRNEVLEPSKLPVNLTQCSVHNADCRSTHCCRQAGLQCFEKNEYWATCRKECQPGSLNPEDSLQNRQPWTCRPLGPRTPTETTTARQHKASSGNLTTDACTDEVVLEILGSDLSSNLAAGTDAEILIGNLRIPAELVSIQHRQNNKSVAEASKPESWWNGPFRVLLLVAAALLACLGPFAVALYVWRRSVQEQEQQSPLSVRQLSVETPRSARGQGTQHRDPCALFLW
jgi:hypothetical protein